MDLTNKFKHLFKTVGWVVTLLVAASTQADELDKQLQQIMTERHIPGLQLAVVKDGVIIRTGNYGVSNIQHGVAVKADTVFPINSMTKAFTGVALMQLQEKGVLNINDTIGKHLSKLPEKWKSLTIKQLMTHTSGLPHILSGRLVDMIVHADPQAAWQKVQTLPMQFEPGSQFSYNQTGYALIGKIIDKYVKDGFPAFIADNQFKPTGMKLTAAAGFDYLEYVVPNQAAQYFYTNEQKYRNFYGEFPYILRTAAGMSSTATELAKYLIALQADKLLKSTEILWTPARLNNGKTGGFNNMENGYAIGWQIIDRPNHKAVSASGGNAVTMIYYPEDKVSVVVLTNLIGGLPIQFVDKIAAHFIDGFKL